MQKTGSERRRRGENMGFRPEMVRVSHHFVRPRMSIVWPWECVKSVSYLDDGISIAWWIQKTRVQNTALFASQLISESNTNYFEDLVTKREKVSHEQDKIFQVINNDIAHVNKSTLHTLNQTSRNDIFHTCTVASREGSWPPFTRSFFPLIRRVTGQSKYIVCMPWVDKRLSRSLLREVSSE